jgi:2-hydroxy-3-keto-5-methylthiopentenyl-1-phosphate phosphatase
MVMKGCGRVVEMSWRGSSSLGSSSFSYFNACITFPSLSLILSVTMHCDLNLPVLHDHSEASRDQLDSITTPFDKCIEKLLDSVELDEYFMAFYKWAVSVSIPVVVLSGGITPIIHAVLTKLIGPEAESIEVIANAVVPREGFNSINEEGGAWRVEFRDDSNYGHDKARTIKPYARHRDGMKQEVKPILLYAGDGVSDLSAAKETELLFAKEGQGASVCYGRH